MSVPPRRALFGRQKCLLLHQCRNEMAAGVGSAPTSADLQSAAHLSEPSSVFLKMVPRRGDAPRSAGYRPAALLLSYRGMKNWRSTRESHSGRLYGAQRFSGPFPRLCRTCSFKRCPHQDSHLEPRPLEAAYAYSITPCGHETGSSGWIRTNTAALTERHPAVRSPRILKWWSRTVMLRRLLIAKQLCSLLHYGPFGNWRSVRALLPRPSARQAGALLN